MGKLYLYESVADTDFHFHVLLWVKFDVQFPEPRQHVFYKDYQYEIRALSESGTKLSCFTCRQGKNDLCTLILQGRQSNKINDLELESSLLFSDNEESKLLIKKFAFQLNQFPTSQRFNR